MQTKSFLRSRLLKLLHCETALTLHSDAVDPRPHLALTGELGIYLHIPFCRQICPYCPYNKELYCSTIAERYADAVVQEIDLYADLVGNRPITSFYIGGGTPTTMLDSGLPRLLDHIYKTFNMQCGIHMESHPNDLTEDNLDFIRGLGVQHLSMGIEALQDHHLRALCRPYTVAQALGAIDRSLDHGFQCVNVDIMFALPGQTHDELRQTAEILTKRGVGQVATYPLFTFPYTQWPQRVKQQHYAGYSLLQKRRMLAIMEGIFYDAGYERTSVWAFTRNGIPKYCSVTVPTYLGLGAGAASYLYNIFYVNTFSVADYIYALDTGRMPIALSLSLSAPMQMAGWLYWRIYATRFHRRDFQARFGVPFDSVYGGYFKFLSTLGFLYENRDEIVLTDAGAFWLHAVQDLFSLDYVSELWGRARCDPWPKRVVF